MTHPLRTEPSFGRMALRSACAYGLACGLLLAAIGPRAETLSSPQASGNPKSAAPAAPGFDWPVGQGPGVHGANSIFPPLSARDDVVPWSVLTAVNVKKEKNRILPVFNLPQLALHQKTQRIQGFMMPLDPGEKQNHFLLSSVPLTCPFCAPGGPESMVEVKTKTPVKYSMEPVVVEGRFLVLNDDAYGLYYRITDATSVK
ncbi:DUF3299 domain-containing protein [Polaromonas jejuensis]|uniref:DUF3299 domain-containing protein n=1 Tax=Polaromonas jejuensis TaxID=457502 RepID=A0ABW0Q998_9BURK|nr:DUF3299 domain-containing protein [Polaromonas jejuensis]